MAAKVSNHFQKMMQDEIDRLATQMKMAHEQVQGKPVNSVDVSGNDPEMEKLAQPGTAKPAVTAEQYARGREVLDALPPGAAAGSSVRSAHESAMEAASVLAVYPRHRSVRGNVVVPLRHDA
jgi:hypothetical protein